MNREQAKKALERGFRLTHRHFSDDEWVEKSKDYVGKYLFEDGNVCSIHDFWSFRHDDNFDKDWSVKPIFKVGDMFMMRHKPSIFSEEIVDETVSIKEIKGSMYFLSNHTDYFIPTFEEKLKDGILIDIREELSDNYLR